MDQIPLTWIAEALRRHCVAMLVVAATLLSPSPLASQTYSSSITARYRTIPNVTYLKLGAWEGKLDVLYRADGGPYPTVIWFHGGDSMSGAKEASLLSIVPYLEFGWNVVNIEHRLPGVTLAPAALQNSVCALRWVAEHAKEFNIDVRKLIMSGSSSGGWFALGAAMAPDDAGWHQACPEAAPAPVAAIVNWYGVADFVDVFQGPNAKPYGPGWVRGLANPVEIGKSVSPLTFVRASGPPVISIHGDADPTVPYSHSVRLHEALKGLGVSERLVTIPGGKHGFFSRSQNETAFKAIEDFLAKQGILADRAQ